MAKATMSPYDSRTETTRAKICGNMTSYTPNKTYRHESGNFYFYINQRGYIHVIQPRKTKFDGKVYFYMSDMLLTVENTLKETGTGRMCKSLEECIADFEERNEL